MLPSGQLGAIVEYSDKGPKAAILLVLELQPLRLCPFGDGGLCQSYVEVIGELQGPSCSQQCNPFPVHP